MRSSSRYGSVMRLTGLAAIVLLAAGCTPIHISSRTGVVKDIIIVEAPNPAELTVNPGDEVRWVNRRTQPIEIDLLETRIPELSCNRGFIDVFGGPRENVTLEANGTASACFPIAGVIRYNVRMESALPGGKKIVSGVVKVGS